VVGLGYLAVTLLAAYQASQAESVVKPSNQTLWTLGAIVLTTAIASALTALWPLKANRPTAVYRQGDLE
jgi:hypothetical protein